MAPKTEIIRFASLGQVLVLRPSERIASYSEVVPQRLAATITRGTEGEQSCLTSLYDLLRITPAASLAELRVAFSLRHLTSDPLKLRGCLKP